MPRNDSSARRIAAALRDYFKRGVRIFYRGQFLVSAQAVAFRVLVTWVPVVLLATGVIGFLLSRAGPYAILEDLLTSYFPAYETDRLVEFVGALERVSGTFTAVGFIALTYAAVTLLTTLRVTVSNVFREDWHRSRRTAHGLAFDVRMMLQLALLFLATVILSIIAQFLDGSGTEFLHRIGVSSEWLLGGWRRAAHYFSLIVPLILSIGMFFQLYYFVPLPHPPRPSVWLGAGVAAVLWEAGKFLFARYTIAINRYDGLVAAIESDRLGLLADVFGLIVAFVLWAYYSGIVLMIGATVVLVHEMRRRERRNDRSDD